MKLLISDNRKIASIQEEFNRLFPYLKIEVFAHKHKSGGLSEKKDMISNEKTLSSYRTIHTTGEITITPAMTVSNLEQCFGNIYGLGVQVFRKSGKVWLETTVTDSWTLEQQNKQGEELSKFDARIN